MTSYLKKTKLKIRTYLSINESFYSHKKDAAHQCYQSLGSVETGMATDIEYPVSHFQETVDARNQEKTSP